MLVREHRVVKTHQHSAQGRSVQALSDLALSFVTALLSRHLHVPHRHSNSGFPYLVSQWEPRPWRCWIMLICCGNQWMEQTEWWEIHHSTWFISIHSTSFIINSKLFVYNTSGFQDAECYSSHYECSLTSLRNLNILHRKKVSIHFSDYLEKL